MPQEHQTVYICCRTPTFVITTYLHNIALISKLQKKSPCFHFTQILNLILNLRSRRRRLSLSFDLIPCQVTLGLVSFSRRLHISVKVLERTILLTCSIRNKVKIKIVQNKIPLVEGFVTPAGPDSLPRVHYLAPYSCQLWKQNQTCVFSRLHLRSSQVSPTIYLH